MKGAGKFPKLWKKSEKPPAAGSQKFKDHKNKEANKVSVGVY